MKRTLIGLGALFGLALAQSGGAALAQSAGDPVRGEAVYQDRCGMCHALGGPGQGPDLIGVVGRKAGSAPDFNYTPALTAWGQAWSPASLGQFLTDPQAMVPGTAMRAKVPDAGDRRDLIAYLASLKS